MSVLQHALVLIAVVTLADRVGAAVPPPIPHPSANVADEELEKLQGTWELVFVDDSGKPLGREVKRVHGKQETVDSFDASGHLVRRRTAQLDVQIVGPARIVLWSMEVVLGADQGRRQQGSFVSRVSGDSWYEFQGALIGQEREPPQVVVWRKVREI